MPPGDANNLLQHLRRLSASARTQNVSDSELVDSFVATRDDTAFTALFQRHGPMVLSLCRRVLRNEHEADDAFQATFLVFARKAPSLRSREAVSSWLYGIAYRTALKARYSASRRRTHEAAAPTRSPADPLSEMTVLEAQEIIDREMSALPDKFRAPLVLCCLEGLARDEAAQRLGCTLSLLKSRLEQARELLRNRLARRGLTLPAALLAVGLLGTTSEAAFPPGLAAATLKAIELVAAGASATPTVSPNVVSLADGVIRSMFLSKVKVAIAAALVFLAAGFGLVGAVQLHGASAPDSQAARRQPAPQQNVVAPVPEPGAEPLPIKPQSLENWGRSEVVVVARLVKVIEGPAARSNPPIYNNRLQLKIDKVLRGSMKKDETLTANHSAQQQQPPVYPEGKDCLVSLSFVRDMWTVKGIQEATAEELKQAELAFSVPAGWTIEKGRLLSPWAKLGKKAWPAEAKGKVPFVCAETGRPALFVGPELDFKVEPLPPKEKLKYGNPDGDGEYQVIVKNPTDKTITVPALLTDGKTILWDESLVAICQGKIYPMPGARGMVTPAKPVVLKAGEEVTGVVNILKFQGPQWPMGGYRIEFQFCLGEKCATKSFYYLSKHHDPLREKALADK